MTDETIKDITIIGAGPSGLFTAFQAGMHEASVRIIDSLPEPGGQLTALYPEKYVFDAPGFSKITAKELARNLFDQANQFAPEFRLGETVIDIRRPLASAQGGKDNEGVSRQSDPSQEGKDSVSLYTQSVPPQGIEESNEVAPQSVGSQGKNKSRITQQQPELTQSEGSNEAPPPSQGKMGAAGTSMLSAGKADDLSIFEVITDQGSYRSRAVIIATGLGAFKPRTLGIPDIEKFEGKGLSYFIREKDSLKGKDIVIVGGGDSALDWVINLLDTARDITLVHRKETFRAHPNTLQQVSENARKGRVRILTPYEVKGVSGGSNLEQVTVVDGDGKETTLRTDALLLMLGFSSDLGPLEKWGLEIDDNRIKVGINMETNRKGIFAVGDIANYPGKLKLILTGFSDSAQAVRSAVPYIRPGGKVRHAHSTSLKVFSG